MEIYAVCRKFIAFSVSVEKLIDEKKCEKLIRDLLRENNIPQWNKICLDIFTGDESALYLAYPNDETQISLAAYAIPFLQQYFTE